MNKIVRKKMYSLPNTVIYFAKCVSTEIVFEEWNSSCRKLKVRRLKNFREEIFFFAHFSFDFVSTDSEFVVEMKGRGCKMSYTIFFEDRAIAENEAPLNTWL